MKLKNATVIALARCGALEIKTSGIPASKAYEVLKFRRAIQRVFAELQESEKTIINECNLEVSKNGSVNGSESDRARFFELQSALYNEESEIGDINAIPYDDWHALQQDNGGLCEPYIEDALENVLWVAPKN